MSEQDIKDLLIQLSGAVFGTSVDFLRFLLDFERDGQGVLVDTAVRSLDVCERAAFKLIYDLNRDAGNSYREVYRELGGHLCDACRALYNAALELYTADPGIAPQPVIYLAKEAAECCNSLERVCRSTERIDRPELLSAVVIGMDTVHAEAREYYARNARELYKVPDFPGEALRRVCLYLIDCIASCRAAIHLFKSLIRCEGSRP